VEEELVVK